MSLYCILKFFRETQGKFPRRNFPTDSTGKEGGNIHIENSPSFPQGNYEEICTGMIPWTYPINPRGNLGDVNGLPAGPLMLALNMSQKYHLGIEKVTFLVPDFQVQPLGHN